LKTHRGIKVSFSGRLIGGPEGETVAKLGIEDTRMGDVALRGIIVFFIGQSKTICSASANKC